MTLVLWFYGGSLVWSDCSARFYTGLMSTKEISKSGIWWISTTKPGSALFCWVAHCHLMRLFSGECLGNLEYWHWSITQCWQLWYKKQWQQENRLKYSVKTAWISILNRSYCTLSSFAWKHPWNTTTLLKDSTFYNDCISEKSKTAMGWSHVIH